MERRQRDALALLILGALAWGCSPTRHFRHGGGAGAAGIAANAGAAGLGGKGGQGGAPATGGSGGGGDHSEGASTASGESGQGTDGGSGGSSGSTGGGGMSGASGLSDGTACEVDADCTNGHCIDHVCCATTCGDCDACTKELTGQPDGTCAPVVSGKDPHDYCEDETATNQCGNDGTCDGAGACRNVGASHECAPAACSSDGKTYTPAATCDGKGQCSEASAEACGNAACTLVNGCLTSCITSDECRKGFFCDTSSGTCTIAKKNGDAATDAGQCASGVVADGVCCDKPCTGCSACTLALNHQTGSAADGQCLAVLPGVAAPHGACPASSGAPCGPDGTCDGANGCSAPAVGTTCGVASCTGSTLTTKTCNASQECTPKADSCPSSLVCNSSKTACLSGCAKDADCTSGFCVGGVCGATKNVGDSCSSSGECPNGYCVDGYCCNGKCDGDCQSCSQTPGQCKTVTTPRTSCTGSGTCGKKYCDGTHTSCVFPGSSTACPNQCSSDLGSVVSSSCDGAGNCGTGTASPCNSSQYCSTSNNQCTSKIGNGSSCTKDIQCSSSKCCSTCVNTSTDNNNCGGCNTKCGANTSCKTGSCACNGFTFPPACGSTCGSWSFESGASTTENWIAMVSPHDAANLGQGALNVAISSNRPSGYPGTGSYSLVVPFIINGSTSAIASVAVQFCQPGKYTSVGGYNLSGYVYVSGSGAFPDYASFQAVTWGADASQSAQTIILLDTPSNTPLVPNTWIHFSTDMAFGFQYDHLALVLGPNGSYNGTMYLDDVQFTGL